VCILYLNSMMFGQDFYDINTINTVEITFEESNWDYLLDQLYAAGLEKRLTGSVTINLNIITVIERNRIVFD